MGSGRIPRTYYRRETLVVAQDLIGRVLCRRLSDGRILRGRIVEVEAYDGFDDEASHASRGRTPRNAPMFEAGGQAYVYLIYGVHHCLNIVTGDRDYPAAVLLRATEPPEESVSASGPGRLTRAFRIDRAQDRVSFAGRELWLEQGRPPPPGNIRRTPRIGVDYAGAWARKPYRFVETGHPAASGPKRMR